MFIQNKLSNFIFFFLGYAIKCAVIISHRIHPDSSPQQTYNKSQTCHVRAKTARVAPFEWAIEEYIILMAKTERRAF